MGYPEAYQPSEHHRALDALIADITGRPRPKPLTLTNADECDDAGPEHPAPGEDTIVAHPCAIMLRLEDKVYSLAAPR